MITSGSLSSSDLQLKGVKSQDWTLGVVYAPYVPLVITDLSNNSTAFSPRNGIKSRYSHISADFYRIETVETIIVRKIV